MKERGNGSVQSTLMTTAQGGGVVEGRFWIFINKLINFLDGGA